MTCYTKDISEADTSRRREEARRRPSSTSPRTRVCRTAGSARRGLSRSARRYRIAADAAKNDAACFFDRQQARERRLRAYRRFSLALISQEKNKMRDTTRRSSFIAADIGFKSICKKRGANTASALAATMPIELAVITRRSITSRSQQSLFRIPADAHALKVSRDGAVMRQ